MRRPSGVGVRRAGDAAGDAGERDGAAAAGQADVVGDLGDRADLGEFAVVTRDEQDPLLVAHVDGKRHIHGREDHGVVQRDEQKRGHGVFSFTFCSHLHLSYAVTSGDETARKRSQSR